MSNKYQLRGQRNDTVINMVSKKEDSQCKQVVDEVINEIQKEFGVKLIRENRIKLVDIISVLSSVFPTVKFAKPEKETSFMTPDGGITYLEDIRGKKYPVLIAEVKNQGTNDIRISEGKKKQAQGNAVERLGKNVIGFRAYMLEEGIFPFVCFGDGCDFEKGSSILDRVLTIAMFGSMNEDHTSNEGPNGIFNRGSYYFRRENWTASEMKKILKEVTRKSIFYYFSKYGDERFTESSKEKVCGVM